MRIVNCRPDRRQDTPTRVYLIPASNVNYFLTITRLNRQVDIALPRRPSLAEVLVKYLPKALIQDTERG